MSSEQLEGAMAAVGEKLVVLEKEGLLREGQSAEELGRKVTPSTNLEEALQGAVYVQVREGGRGRENGRRKSLKFLKSETIVIKC